MLSNETQTYAQYYPQILMASAKQYKLYGIPVEDSISVCNLAFVIACRDWEPENSSFRTYLTQKINSYLKTDLIKRTRTNRLDTEYLDQIHESDLSEGNGQGFVDICDNISRKGKEIINLILDTPEELMLLIKQRGGRVKSVRWCLAKYLVEYKNWNREAVAYAFKEIQTAIGAIPYERA